MVEVRALNQPEINLLTPGALLQRPVAKHAQGPHHIGYGLQAGHGHSGSRRITKQGMDVYNIVVFEVMPEPASQGRRKDKPPHRPQGGRQTGKKPNRHPLVLDTLMEGYRQ
jgi:hypothetical protein